MKDKILRVRIPAPIFDRLKKEAASEGKTVSEGVRDLIESGLGHGPSSIIFNLNKLLDEYSENLMDLIARSSQISRKNEDHFLAGEVARIGALLNLISAKIDLAGHPDRMRQADAVSAQKLSK